MSSLALDDFAWLAATEQRAALNARGLFSAELVERRCPSLPTRPRRPVDIQVKGPSGGDRTTMEFTALLTEGFGSCRIPPQYRSPAPSTV